MYLAIFTKARFCDYEPQFEFTQEAVMDTVDTEEQLNRIKNKVKPYRLSGGKDIMYEDAYLSEAFHKVE